MSAVERQRRYRARQRANSLLISIEVGWEFQELMAGIGMFHRDDERDREQVKQRLEQLHEKLRAVGVMRLRALLEGLPSLPTTNNDERTM